MKGCHCLVLPFCVKCAVEVCLTPDVCMKLLHVRKKDYAVGCGSQNMNQWHAHPLLQLKKIHGSEC